MHSFYTFIAYSCTHKYTTALFEKLGIHQYCQGMFFFNQQDSEPEDQNEVCAGLVSSFWVFHYLKMEGEGLTYNMSDVTSDKEGRNPDRKSAV